MTIFERLMEAEDKYAKYKVIYDYHHKHGIRAMCVLFFGFGVQIIMSVVFQGYIDLWAFGCLILGTFSSVGMFCWHMHRRDDADMKVGTAWSSVCSYRRFRWTPVGKLELFATEEIKEENS